MNPTTISELTNQLHTRGLKLRLIFSDGAWVAEVWKDSGSKVPESVGKGDTMEIATIKALVGVLE